MMPIATGLEREEIEAELQVPAWLLCRRFIFYYGVICLSKY